jgi:hypothetical protein
MRLKQELFVLSATRRRTLSSCHLAKILLPDFPGNGKKQAKTGLARYKT